MEEKQFWWEKDGLRFECVQCGRCCGIEPGSIWVTPEEIRRIAEFLDIDEIKLRMEYLTRNMGKTSIKELDNFDCVFLERNSHCCAIYKVRPLQCRLFPFWPSLLKSKKIWNYYANKCPGMNNGKLYTPEMIKMYQKIDVWPDL